MTRPVSKNVCVCVCVMTFISDLNRLYRGCLYKLHTHTHTHTHACVQNGRVALTFYLALHLIDLYLSIYISLSRSLRAHTHPHGTADRVGVPLKRDGDCGGERRWGCIASGGGTQRGKRRERTAEAEDLAVKLAAQKVP